MSGDTTTAQWQPSLGGGDLRLSEPAFVLVGARAHPERVGEVAFLPHPGEEAVLGRRGSLRWMRHRPGARDVTGPVDDGIISREQVVLTHDGHRPRARNVGRLPLLLNGHPVDECPLEPGDLVEVGDRLMLFVTWRPRELPGRVERGHAFGRADAHGWVGESPAAWRVRDEVRFVARRHAHVLVLGESGTGKELVARALHGLSERANRPLVSRNAATIPESLADAELFGNLAGYPNPGMPVRPGLVGEAHASTLFLDEFGELPVEMQARLLRVLDSGEYTRLGEARPRHADLRLVAATNRDPSSIKHDVLARLQIRIEVPPLSDRIEDIPLVAAQLLRRIASDDRELARRFFPGGDLEAPPRISLRLVRQLLVHRYTTHVRELEALLWRAITASPGEVLDVVPKRELAAMVAPPRAPSGPVDPSALDPELVQAALDRHGGSQEPVWRELGLASRHVLARFVKKHNLKVRGRPPE